MVSQITLVSQTSQSSVALEGFCSLCKVDVMFCTVKEKQYFMCLLVNAHYSLGLSQSCPSEPVLPKVSQSCPK